MKVKTLPSFEYEDQLWQRGISYVAGIDEVGRGAFAGPLVAATVIFPPGCAGIDEVNDSKLLSAKKRRQLAGIIKQQANYFSIVEVPVSYINRYGIGKANQLAFRKLVSNVRHKTPFFLVDGFPIQGVSKKRQKAIIKGDRKSLSIAAASILAKVERDSCMESLHELYKEYNFKQNKGYGTLEHRLALRRYGDCVLHRKSFVRKNVF